VLVCCTGTYHDEKISDLYEGNTANQVNNDGLSRHGNDTKQKQRTADAAAASSWSRLMTHDCSAQSSATRFSSVMIMLSKSMSSDTDHSSKPKALLQTVYTTQSSEMNNCNCNYYGVTFPDKTFPGQSLLQNFQFN